MEKKKILIVDDQKENIDVLVGFLGGHYTLVVTRNPVEVFSLASEKKPDLILLDIMMPEVDGYEVITALKAFDGTREIPVIFMSALADLENKKKGFLVGAVDYISKPFEIEEVELRIKTQLDLQEAKRKIASYNEVLEKKVEERTREVLLTQQATFMSLAALAEYRDPETGGHLERVKQYVEILSLRLAEEEAYQELLTPEFREKIAVSCSLHDIGKVGVPDVILLKPGPLTPEEFVEVQKHTHYGRDAIMAAERKLGVDSFLSVAREIAYTHHEKWDGSGYPEGLSMEAIPLSGRIMAIADVYDALISRRVYKPPIPHKEALQIMEKERGRQFDPHLLDIFMELEEEFRRIAMAYAESEEELEAVKER